jgi:thiol-disulfide isomerase/thioredoxin
MKISFRISLLPFLFMGILAYLPQSLYAGATADAGAKRETAVAAEKPALPEKVEIYFFYEEVCELCSVLTEYYAILDEQIPGDVRERYPHVFLTYNVFQTVGKAEYERITDEMGFDRDSLSLPFMIAGGRVFQGLDTIKSNILEAYLTAGEELFVYRRAYTPGSKKTGPRLFEDYPVSADHANIVYFYRPTCPSCAQITPIIDELAPSVTVGGVTYPLDITRFNTRAGNNNERISAFFEAYNVPDADRLVPIIFFGDSYLVEVEPIKAELQGRLKKAPDPSSKILKLLPVR